MKTNNKIGQFYRPILSADFLGEIKPSSTAEFIADEIGQFYRSCVTQKSADFTVRLSSALVLLALYYKCHIMYVADVLQGSYYPTQYLRWFEKNCQVTILHEHNHTYPHTGISLCTFYSMTVHAVIWQGDREGSEVNEIQQSSKTRWSLSAFDM